MPVVCLSVMPETKMLALITLVPPIVFSILTCICDGLNQEILLLTFSSALDILNDARFVFVSW